LSVTKRPDTYRWCRAARRYGSKADLGALHDVEVGQIGLGPATGHMVSTAGLTAKGADMMWEK